MSFDDLATPMAANYVPLSPVSFLARAARIYPDKTAVIYGAERTTYKVLYDRCRQLASALSAKGIKKGDVVSVMAPNVPALLEAHYGVLMIGAVLNAINTRLDGDTVGYILEHAEAKIFIADNMHGDVVKAALSGVKNPPELIRIDDPTEPDLAPLADMDYENFIKNGDPDFVYHLPENEWQAISLNYTSGTTGRPKGVVYHSRGAYLNALSNLITFGLDRDSVYLWTLPMFHCNGWCYPWAVVAAGAAHVCLRKPEAAPIFKAIGTHHVTHMCGAPIVMNMLVHAPDADKEPIVGLAHKVEFATGGAAPPSAVISAMENMSFNLTHVYGMTECYGPATFCAPQTEWDALDPSKRAEKMARQGVQMVALEDVRVFDEYQDSATARKSGLRDVPADAQTLGMLAVKGNIVMAGYYKNPEATEEALGSGYLITGDLAVTHPDTYVEIKDRAKDIIISGGENISSLEIEETLYKHPMIMEAAVVAAPDEQWGEIPCAFVTPRPDSVDQISEAQVIEFCKENMARFKAPKRVIFGPLPKTPTGKIQKFLLRDQVKP